VDITVKWWDGSLINDSDVGMKCGLLNQRPTLVRLTANGRRGCNKHGGEEFESKRVPVRGVLASAETTSSVPPDFFDLQSAAWPLTHSGISIDVAY
jgi:hypothetical protein